MEQQANKDWNFIKGTFSHTYKTTVNRPYITDQELQEMEQKIKKAFRQKKLERILNNNI